MRIDGRQIADKIYEELKKRVGELRKKGITPYLTVILVGNNPSSQSYVRQKQKWGEFIGAGVEVLHFDENVSTEELEKKVKELNNNPKVHAILIQRPLPPQINIPKLELLVDPQKDIDGFHPKSPYTLPLPLAVVKILEEIYFLKNPKHEIRNPKQIQNSNDQNSKRFEPSDFVNWLNYQQIIVLGKGPTGGKPIIEYLNKLNVHPQLIDSKTPNPVELTKNADIVISAIGRENILKPENIKKGAILIGVGISRGIDGKMHGDYSEESMDKIAGCYTPTPGGIGPVNVAMLMTNLLDTTEKQSFKSSSSNI